MKRFPKSWIGFVTTVLKYASESLGMLKEELNGRSM
jgi:hypothetical protein